MAGNLTTEAAHPVGSTIARQQHVLGLDTVRALAALSVVLAHILTPKLPDMLLALGVSQELAQLARYAFTGHPAVIVFFVVSGFCIHYPYTRRELPVVAFTMARWTRIMIPVLVAMLFAKLFRIRTFNFIDGFILWSIVCELWYYTLYPVFLWISRKISFEMQFIMAFLNSIVLVACIGSDQYGSANVFGPALNWLIALPSWLLGCILAKHIASGVSIKESGKYGIYLWRVGVAAVASILYWLTQHTSVGFSLTMNPFAILVFFWLRAEIATQKNATNSLLERTGQWSYSIYLFHMILLTFVNKLLGSYVNSQTAVPLITIPLILWMSYYIYKHVEKPSHEYARKLYGKYRDRYRGISVAQHSAHIIAPSYAGRS